MKVAVVFPCATVTAGGTLATDELSLARFTTIPPLGAGWLSATEAMEDVAPTTATGLRLSERTVAAGVIVMVRFEETLLPW